MSSAFGTHQVTEDVLWVGYISSIISLISSLYVIISYLMYKETRQNYFFFLIVNICAIDICFGVSSVPLLTLATEGSDFTDDPVCTIFGVLRTFAILSSHCLNTLFAWAIYCSLTLTSIDTVRTVSYYYKRVAIIYAFCIIASLLPLLTDSIGQGTLYCDLKASDEPWDLIWQFADYIMPFVIAFSVIITLMAVTIWKVKKIYPESGLGGRLLRLLLFPAIFLLVNSGGFCSRVLNLFARTPPGLAIYHFLCRQTQGTIHGGIYGFIFLLDRPKPTEEEQKAHIDSRNSSIATIPENEDHAHARKISDFY